MTMTRNVGTVERVIRAVLGIALLVYFALNYTALILVWNIVLVAVGLILLITGIIGFSPIYALFKLESSDFPGIHRIKHV
jgi:hypothetical protein